MSAQDEITTSILRDIAPLFSAPASEAAVSAINDPEELEIRVFGSASRIEGALEEIIESASTAEHAAALIADLPQDEIQELFAYCLIAAGRIGRDAVNHKEVRP